MKKFIVLTYVAFFALSLVGCSAMKSSIDAGIKSNNDNSILQDEENQNNSVPSGESAASSDEPSATTTPNVTDAPTPTPEPDPLDNMSVYYEGQYKVGVDIPSGEYMVFSINGRGYFCVSSDANGNDILFNDNFEANSIITVYDGEFLELSRSSAVSTEEFYSAYTVKSDIQGVMLKVGIDIPAGEYKLDAGENSGYYCIYSDSRHGDIIANNNFSGTNYVSVSDGNYLQLTRCIIIQ